MVWELKAKKLNFLYYFSSLLFHYMYLSKSFPFQPISWKWQFIEFIQSWQSATLYASSGTRQLYNKLFRMLVGWTTRYLHLVRNDAVYTNSAVIWCEFSSVFFAFVTFSFQSRFKQAKKTTQSSNFHSNLQHKCKFEMSCESLGLISAIIIWLFISWSNCRNVTESTW